MPMLKSRQDDKRLAWLMGQLASTRQRFEAAPHERIDEIREDKNIPAAILCGSLSHDEVWDRSDIDLVAQAG